MPAYYKLCHRIPDDAVVADTGGGIGNRHWFCFWFPVFVPINPYGVIPDPGPVFSHPELSPEDVRNMNALAMIDNLAEGLTGNLSQQIQESVAAHMQHFKRKLGKGFDLSRHTERG
jgi:hypothetical protein